MHNLKNLQRGKEVVSNPGSYSCDSPCFYRGKCCLLEASRGDAKTGSPGGNAFKSRAERCNVLSAHLGRTRFRVR